MSQPKYYFPSVQSIFQNNEMAEEFASSVDKIRGRYLGDFIGIIYRDSG